MSVGQMSQLMKKKIFLDYSCDDDFESTDKNEDELEKLELERELWKEKVNLISFVITAVLSIISMLWQG